MNSSKTSPKHSYIIWGNNTIENAVNIPSSFRATRRSLATTFAAGGDRNALRPMTPMRTAAACSSMILGSLIFYFKIETYFSGINYLKQIISFSKTNKGY